MPMNLDTSKRTTLLREAALAAGHWWFAAWREDLSHAGRAVEGGWPGTLSEARALSARFVREALKSRRARTATNEELTWATRVTYAEARRTWLSSKVRRRGSPSPRPGL